MRRSGGFIRSALKLRRDKLGNTEMNHKTIDGARTRSDAERRASDRRAHRRIASAELPKSALIRIPNRPAVSLIDVSSGGALLELPFQMPPESRFTLELSTPQGSPGRSVPVAQVLRRRLERRRSLPCGGRVRPDSQTSRVFSRGARAVGVGSTHRNPRRVSSHESDS